MDVRAFRSRIIKLSAFMLIIIVGFPFILYGLVKLTSCGGGGTCGAIAAMGGMILRPLALGVFVIGVGKAISQRCRHARLSRVWMIMALLWMIGSSSFLLGAQNHWGANFAMGLFAIRPPVLLLLLAAFTVFLSFYHGQESDNVDGNDLRVAWLLAWFSTGLALFLNLPAVKEPFVMLLRLFNIFPMQTISTFNKAFHTFIHLDPSIHLALSWIAPATFSLALLYIYIRSRQQLIPETNGLGFQK